MPTPVIPVESFASRQDITPSLAVWRDRHRLFEALSNSTDLREHAHIGDHSIWPLVESELAGVTDLQLPWSARAMDEAGAALDRLAPDVAVTYAEAGGWGRALMLEARRRGIPSVGLQHGFIYRHWLNYLHDADEMTAVAGQSGRCGLPGARADAALRPLRRAAPDRAWPLSAGRVARDRQPASRRARRPRRVFLRRRPVGHARAARRGGE